ncbi:polymeric immunoglobulin receptor-like isoform X2 [Genypterus blacodes]|uniref:polymeric immunoglobulin receptor-like isoform X2 n=1 Tax=Genypterus blacodes TaxID=154954 RepID=UPI003F758DF5
MASCLGIFFFVAGLTGIYSVFTIRKVPVKARGSITIPCLYDSSYRDHVKYLCAGDSWHSCVYKVRTNKPDSSGKFSISDDRAKSIFTVTINDLKVHDSYFWCIVERNGADAGEQFQLSVTENAPTLSVSDQEVNGSNGQSVTIGCHHTSGVVQWCKLGSSCVKEQSGLIGEARVKINASDHGVSMVMMSGLVPNSSDWYWCDTGDLQVPVRVNMKEKVQPTTPTPQVTTSGPATDGHGSRVSLDSILILLGLLTFLSRAKRNPETPQGDQMLAVTMVSHIPLLSLKNLKPLMRLKLKQMKMLCTAQWLRTALHK